MGYTEPMALPQITGFSMRYLQALVPVCLLLATMHATGSTVLQNGAVVQLQKTASDQMALNIRLAEPEPITRVTARIGVTPVSITDTNQYPLAGQASAVLFLVDTSDPSRQQAIRQAVGHIEQIIGQSNGHLRYGLARFDTDLHLLAPIGTGSVQLLEKARSLSAVGKTTELYRNTLGAIRILNRYPADRRFLFLLSDGLAEDRAYFHRDVIQSAINNDVSIYTIGYSGSVSRTVALQTLRRLSEDTGGQYLPTVPGSYQLDHSQLEKLLRTLDSGIQLKASFRAIVEAGIGGTQQLDLSIDTTANSYIIGVPVKLPRIASRPVQQAGAVSQLAGPAPVRQVIVKHVPAESEGLQNNSWLLLVAVSLLMMGLLIFLALRLRSGSEIPASMVCEPAAEQEPYAWLERIDGTVDERYPILSGKTKIGRFRGNDVALHDPAVSRYHAEIRFNDAGEFMIADLGSKNGIMVNDEEVYERVLHDQDIIEIGDIRLRFTIQSDFAEDMQDTEMFRTQFPLPSSANH